MKKFIWGIIVGAIVMGFIASFIDGIVKEQEIREASAIEDLRDCATAKTGNHCKMANGREAVIITARGAKH